MKKLFGSLKMSWLATIIFAVAAGLYTGLVMLVPAFKETSIQDIGISYEWWVVFAVIIVVNCKKDWEAMLKCFVFFLISQPLVYIVQVAVGSLGIEWAKMYYFKIWLPMTMLTLPGGLIAYYCKKQNLIGSVILGIGNTIQVVLGTYYAYQAVTDFPHHLLSSLICFISAIIMTYYIQQKTKHRVISLVLPVLLTVAAIVYTKLTGLSFFGN